MISVDELYLICTYLPVPNLINLSVTCHTLRDFSYTENLWIGPVREFQRQHSITGVKSDDQTYRQYFIRLVQDMSFWQKQVLRLDEYNPMKTLSILAHYQKHGNGVMRIYYPLHPQPCKLTPEGLIEFDESLIVAVPMRYVTDLIIDNFLGEGMRYLPQRLDNRDVSHMYQRLVEDGIVS